jgi:hypothetical protein
MLRPRLKTILLSITIIVTLSIIGLALAVWKLDRDMTEKMEQKQFLRPTEYYAFPQTFKKDTRWSIQEVEKEFQKNNYRSRSANQVLLAGDFFVGDQAACDDRAKPDIPSDTKHCIIFVSKNALEGQLNWIFVGDNQIIELWNHEGRVPELQLEALLMAQYLENQPSSAKFR